jgi:hypothetical protein
MNTKMSTSATVIKSRLFQHCQKNKNQCYVSVDSKLPAGLLVVILAPAGSTTEVISRQIHE